MLRFALLFVLFSGFCSSADAQWLRGKRASVSSSCPNGECPTQAAPAQANPEVRGHWSYPGTIDSHLESTHGVATAGMTRQQKLDLHDSLHEGTASKSNYQSVGYSVSYGSSGYKASYGSSGSRASYGSSGGSGGYGSSGSFRVGGRDKDGSVITSIGPVGKPVFSVQPVPSAAPKATACVCGEKCQCNAGGGKCPCGNDLTAWGRPNLDFATESPKQHYVRREDIEVMPAI